LDIFTFMGPFKGHGDAMDDAKSLAGAGPILRDLIDQFGLRHVLVSLLLALRTRRKLPNVDSLPDHLRQDIGLPPRPHGPAPWMIYR
jgi:hypothetical protein